MLCEQCKMREATVKYVEVVNGVKTEHNLCGHCAARLDIGQYSALFEGEISLAKLLSGLLGVPNTEKQDGKLAEVVCPTCGTTYEDFVANSQFGCADCYSVFGPLLGENIRHLQGSEKHVGKRPGNIVSAAPKKNAVDEVSGEAESSSEEETTLTREEQLRYYQARLKDALRREDYEEAAVLRDEIHKLKEETE